MEQELLSAAMDALETAWTIIANAGMNLRQGSVVHVMDDGTEVREAGWCRESEGWEEAAMRWRDTQWHPLLDRTRQATA